MAWRVLACIYRESFIEFRAQAYEGLACARRTLCTRESSVHRQTVSDVPGSLLIESEEHIESLLSWVDEEAGSSVINHSV